MSESLLNQRLGELAWMRRSARLSRAYALCWTGAAALGLGLWAAGSFLGRSFLPALWLLPLMSGAAAAVVARRRVLSRTSEVRDLLNELEPERPEIRHLLAAAAEQKPAAGGLGFLQHRVVEEALRHPGHERWRQQLQRRLASFRIANAAALLALGAATLVLARETRTTAPRFGASEPELTVTPGDTQVERGTALVIAARFGGTPPPEATLELVSESGKKSRLAMARRLADPVFGVSLPEISEGGVYRVNYAGNKSRDYKISVFEFPALVRADARLSYPAYTALTNRTILDTLRVSAVEGSRVGYTLQLNKPVARARLVGRERTLPLLGGSNATVLLPEFVLTKTERFTLELADADGRANKFPSEFVFLALTNRRPMVKLDFPRGDIRVSRLEEVQLTAEASDDFGLLNYGVGYSLAGREPQLIELGGAAPANTPKQFGYLLALETLGVEVDQTVTYFAWADDFGPDGEPRRTFGDMYFADVRPFDEIFRPDQSGGGGGQNPSGNQGGGGNQRQQLAELQKQIVIATWNLQREKSAARGASKP